MVAAFMILLERLYLDSPSEYLPEKNKQHNSSTWDKLVVRLNKILSLTFKKIQPSICGTPIWQTILPRENTHCQGTVGQ